MSTSNALPAFSPLNLQERSVWQQAFAIIIGVGLLTISSHISVPMIPVPMTMQTLAVTMVGALYGKRMGAVTVISWLTAAAFGLPVLANGAGGFAHFFGKTGGYLFAFPMMAFLVGWLAEHGWHGQRPVRAFVAALLGNALCLLMGGVWLAAMIGPTLAFNHGVAPFLLGGLLKSILAAASLKGIDLVLPLNDPPHVL